MEESPLLRTDDMRMLVCATYDPVACLSLLVGPDGRYDLYIGGNAPPLFPPLEMGGYGPGSLPALASLVREARGAMEAHESNHPARPDSAVLYVEHGAEGAFSRSYSLYEPPARWAAVQTALFDLVNGPMRAIPRYTLTMTPNWTPASIRVPAVPALTVRLRSTGTLPVMVANPAAVANWDVYLESLSSPLPGGTRGTSVPSGLIRIETQGVDPLVERVEILPNEHLDVRLTIDRIVPPGNYRALVTYTTPQSLIDPNGNLAIGRLRVESDVLTIVSERW